MFERRKVLSRIGPSQGSPAQNIFERNRWFMPTTGDYAQIVQVFEQFFVFFDWQNDRFAFAVLDNVFCRGCASSHYDDFTAGRANSQTVVETAEQMRNRFLGFVAHVGEAESFAFDRAVARVDYEMMFLAEFFGHGDNVGPLAVLHAG